jgi:hypothetical protein
MRFSFMLGFGLGVVGSAYRLAICVAQPSTARARSDPTQYGLTVFVLGWTDIMGWITT